MSNAKTYPPITNYYEVVLRLNLRQIEAFRAAFQTGSMTAAGTLLHISQPAVSRLIRDLEADTELRLFDRKAGRMTATADAVALYREVQRSFQGLDRVAQAILEIKQKRSGDLRIAASFAPSFYGLPAIMSKFQTQWPGIGLSLRSYSSPDVLDVIARDQADIGIALVPSEAPGVTVEPLKAHNAVCIMSANHPYVRRKTIRPHDLDGQPLLMIANYSLLQNRIRDCLDVSGIALNIVFEASFSAPICAMVAAGAGLSIIDPLTAMEFKSDTMKVRAFKPAIPYELKLILPIGMPLAEHGEAFASLVREHIEHLTRR